MAFYDGLKTVASNLLASKGQQVTVSRETSSGFNPITGINTTSTSTFTGYGVSTNYNQNQIDGTIVQNGDILFILESTDTEPELEDTIVIDSVNYIVKNVIEVSPAGTTVIYKLQLRK